MNPKRRNIWYEIGHKSRLHAIVGGKTVCGIGGTLRGPLNANLRGQELCKTCCRVLGVAPVDRMPVLSRRTRADVGMVPESAGVGRRLVPGLQAFCGGEKIRDSP